LGMKLVSGWPVCSCLNPPGQDILLRTCERSVLGGHDVIVIGREVHSFKQETLGKILGNEGGTGIASFLCKMKGVETKFSLLFLHPVALDA